MWPLKLIILEKQSPVLRVSTHIYGVSKDIGGKTLIFQLNLGMGVSNEIDGKMFIFRVNLGMWPLKPIISEKQTLFWGFQHTFTGFLRR